MEVCKREFNITLISLLHCTNKKCIQTLKFVNQKSKIITKDYCCHDLSCNQYLESDHWATRFYILICNVISIITQEDFSILSTFSAQKEDCRSPWRTYHLPEIILPTNWVIALSSKLVGFFFPTRLFRNLQDAHTLNVYKRKKIKIKVQRKFSILEWCYKVESVGVWVNLFNVTWTIGRHMCQNNYSNVLFEVENDIESVFLGEFCLFRN